jgi:protein TonB
VVKKGKTNAQVKVGQKTIEVKSEQKAEQSKKPTVDVKTPNGVVSKNVPEPDKVFDVVEQMPLFSGGQVELMKYLSANVKYPVEASKKGIQGRVIVQFVVEKDGTISNVKVVNNADEQLKEEAIRVVKTMPKWVPGKQNGKEVRVKYTLPVTFRLN